MVLAMPVSVCALQLEDQRAILGLPIEQPSSQQKTKSSAKKRPNLTTAPVQQETSTEEPAFFPENVDELEDSEQPASAKGDKAGGTDTPTKSSANEDAPAPTAPKAPIRLFSCVEFRGPLKDIPKWANILRKEKQNASFHAGTLNPKVAESVRTQWEKLHTRLKDAPLQEQMKVVNNFFNQWPYKSDMINWSLEDYWATPQEFLRKSGDCEDYAIAKYYALRALGVPARQLRIVALIETVRNIGHAVLVVFNDDKAYVLDNLSSVIVQHTKLPHYDPKFSVNEEYKWVHVRPVKKAK